MCDLIYLDNAATTKPLKEALDSAQKFNEEYFYNPSSLYHGGVSNKSEILSAKETLKKMVGSNFNVIFTSCGTESDNTAIFSYSSRGNIVTTKGEHPAIYAPLNELKNKGYDVRFANINPDGSVDVEHLLSLIDKNTSLVSVVNVNNETGAINDIITISKKCKQINSNLVFHSDGVQAFCKIPQKLSQDIDLYSVSAHKINAIKGVGALFVNNKIKNLKPYLIGGGQENGLRSGTENIFGIKVFENACKYHFPNVSKNYQNAKEKIEIFKNLLDKELFYFISNENCSPYVFSISAKGLRGEVLQHKLEEFNIIVGTGSACSSKNRHSRILKEAGYNEEILDGSIRISISFATTTQELEYTAQILNECANSLKRTILKTK